MTCFVAEEVIEEDHVVAGVLISGKLWKQNKPSKFIAFISRLMWSEEDMSERCIKKIGGKNYKLLSPEKLSASKQLFDKFCSTRKFKAENFNGYISDVLSTSKRKVKKVK